MDISRDNGLHDLMVSRLSGEATRTYCPECGETLGFKFTDGNGDLIIGLSTLIDAAEEYANSIGVGLPYSLHNVVDYARYDNA